VNGCYGCWSCGIKSGVEARVRLCLFGPDGELKHFLSFRLILSISLSHPSRTYGPLPHSSDRCKTHPRDWPLQVLTSEV